MRAAHLIVSLFLEEPLRTAALLRESIESLEEAARSAFIAEHPHARFDTDGAQLEIEEAVVCMCSYAWSLYGHYAALCAQRVPPSFGFRWN